MSLKQSGPATDWTAVDRWDRGVSWIAYPDEPMQRASHVLSTDAGVFVVDPVDAEGIDDLFAEFGDVVGVVLLLDRHKRDCAAVATRHGVPVYVPDWMSGVEDDLAAPSSASTASSRIRTTASTRSSRTRSGRRRLSTGTTTIHWSSRRPSARRTSSSWGRSAWASTRHSA